MSTPTPTPEPTPTPSPTSLGSPAPGKLDRKAPEIEIYGPATRVTTSSELFIGGKVTDNVHVESLEMKIGKDRYRTIPKKGYFEQNVSLAPGRNSILFHATDSSGNRTTLRLAVQRE